MDLVIIGGGPAGLMAAEVAARQGAKITLFDGQPSVGRKFLVAGKGGLNLTHSEPLEKFASHYAGGAPFDFWTSLLRKCDNNTIRNWAADLGIETFIGTSGRVFPREFKAAPLLRRWVARLRSLGVRFEMKHQLCGMKSDDDRFLLKFHTSSGNVDYPANALILALGGASWPETGSDAAWVPLLSSMQIEITPLAPANCGWNVNWNPDILAESEGLPLKNIRATVGALSISGELLITRYGLEGGALYQLGRTLRSLTAPSLTLDLKPSFSPSDLANKILHPSGDLLNAAISRWRLAKAASSLLKHLVPERALTDPLLLANAAKALVIPLSGPRPIAEAISSAGGVAFSELDENLMIKRLPGLFVAGEMIDWEAPTGGYLLQGCFATGTRAARGALRFSGYSADMSKQPR